MNRVGLFIVFTMSLVLHSLAGTRTASAQVYGIELHNNIMPASGGMGGASFSQPQDVQSAINGNPATMTQLGGTQFSFGGGFVEPTYNIIQTAPLPLVGVTPYQAKSSYIPSVVGNIGVSQELLIMGVPTVVGTAFVTNAGLGVDFRGVPESNGTHASYLALDTVGSAAVKLTDYLSIGSNVTIGTGIMDGPFVTSSSMQLDYAYRFTLGANLELYEGVSVGGFWQSEKQHNFENIVRFGNGPFQDMEVEHPNNFGMGIANRNLLNGRLLIAADVLYKQWSEASFFQSIYDDQWVFQLGSQLRVGKRLKLRAGYSYNEDPTLDQVPGTIGGVIPVGGVPTVQYVQGQFASVSEHQISGGFGIENLIPHMDLDMSCGGAFLADKTIGSTTASIESYWISFGMTWHFFPSCDECNQFSDDVIVTDTLSETN